MQGLQQRQTGAIHWQLLPDWEEVLIGPDGLRLGQWLEDGTAQVVKDGTHRTVYRVDLPERSFFLKHYRCETLGRAGRNLVRASAARREWRKMTEVARRDVPTARPIAVGEEMRGGLVRDNFFVTEAIPETCSLDEYLQQVLPGLPRGQAAQVRRAIVTQLAQLCARTHRAGVDQDDLHTGNVLIRFERVAGGAATTAHRLVAEGQATVRHPRLFLIDLPGIRLSGPLNWSRSRDSLVMLNSGLLSLTTRSDRWRFWLAYLAARPDLHVHCPRAAAAEIARRSRAYARRLIRGRDKRCLRNNRDFYRLGKGRGHAVRDVPPQIARQLLADPDRPLRRHRHAPVKISHSSVVVQAELMLAGGPLPVAYKRSRVGSWWKRLLARCRPSRALRGWYLGHALLARGIATARPLVVCQPRASRDSYLATAWIAAGQNLHLYGWQLAQRPPRERARRAARCAESLGRLVGQLHAWHLAHRDLKGGNLLVAEAEHGTQVYLIDLDGLKIARRLTSATRTRNLARLAASLGLHPWVSRTLRLKFLRAYCREIADEKSSSDWKRLWRDVGRKLSRLTRRVRSPDKPLA